MAHDAGIVNSERRLNRLRSRLRYERVTMTSETNRHPQSDAFRGPMWFGWCAFLAIAVFFLWQEHRAHLFGALPYVLLLLCPIIHLFMHRGHDHHGGRHDSHVDHGSPKGGAS